jgi:hypothetical protein
MVYVSPGQGMGIAFETVASEEQTKLQRWLETPEEYSARCTKRGWR